MNSWHYRQRSDRQGVAVTIIAPESWHSNWPLQVKQSMRWVECIGLEGHRGKLKPDVANIGMNLWGHDLQQ